jgi:hypothetical protein
MQASHLKALQTKHSKLEEDIHSELVRPARNEVRIEILKKEKLQIKEQIVRSQETGTDT